VIERGSLEAEIIHQCHALARAGEVERLRQVLEAALQRLEAMTGTTVPRDERTLRAAVERTRASDAHWAALRLARAREHHAGSDQYVCGLNAAMGLLDALRVIPDAAELVLRALGGNPAACDCNCHSVTPHKPRSPRSKTLK